jgi:hypothetical protein
MHYYHILDECWCMLDAFKFCFKHWSTLYCYLLYSYFMHFIVHWMNNLHGCLICVIIVTCALNVSDLFQHRTEHLFDDWRILWSVNLFLTCDWIYLNTINTIQYNTIQYQLYCDILTEIKFAQVLVVRIQTNKFNWYSRNFFHDETHRYKDIIYDYYVQRNHENIFITQLIL